MKYQGQMWSAIIRALLSFRRDRALANDADSDAFGILNDIETGQAPGARLVQTLEALTPPSQISAISKSLIGYFDFNRMGTFFIYLTSSKNITDALQSLKSHSHLFFKDPVGLSIRKQATDVQINWEDTQASILTDYYCYVLLALFRHLAGRQFDFTRVDSVSPDSTASLLSGISHCNISEAGQTQLHFSAQWLVQPSFYYSAQVRKALELSLVSEQALTLTQQITDIFILGGSPARIRAEWVAMQMGMNETAFRRLLKQENLSFSQLLKNFIHDRACQQLLTGEKTDAVALNLGFADRRSFDRSFKEHTGISAGQVRQLGSRLRFQKGNIHLLEVVEQLPPLPDTIQALLALDDASLTIKHVVDIVERDPIFHAHLMGKASKAVYGSEPASLEQAIGRNLGLANIKQLGVVFAAQQMLTTQSRFSEIPLLIDAMLLAEALYRNVFGYHDSNEQADETVRQLLLFGQLSLLLIFHDDCLFVEGALTHMEGADSYTQFLSSLNEDFGLCLYGATSLMLLRWGFKSGINQHLWKLCQAGNEVQINETQFAIKKCHDIAFTALCFDDDVLSQPAIASGLTNTQLGEFERTLEAWAANTATR